MGNVKETSEGSEQIPNANANPDQAGIDLEAQTPPEKSPDGIGPETINDPNEVVWEGSDDFENPKNWPYRRKMYTVAVVMCLVTSVSIASSAIAPAVPQVLEYFHSTNSLQGTLIVSIELLGLGFGPLFFAPMSEVYGRRIMYCLANVAYLLFSAGCALSPSLSALVALRFFQGLMASCCTNNAGGTIADLVPTNRRGAVLSVYTTALLLGPVIGPVFSGYLAAARGWQWIFWLLMMINGPFSLLYAFTCKETYGPVLLERKAKRLRKQTGNHDLYVKGRQQLPLLGLLNRAILRPLKMLFLSPIVAGLALYIATVYGTVYLLFSTFSFVFDDQYHFPESSRGLVYLGLAGGMLISLTGSGFLCDKMYKRLKEKHGIEKPEYRLEPMIYGAFATPTGLLIYGWTIHFNVTPVVPIIATAFVGCGLAFTYVPVQLYLIDSYTKYAGSALAAASILRATVGSLLPLAGLPMYDALGIGWGNTLLALLALMLGGLPLFFLRVGERWRQRFVINFD